MLATRDGLTLTSLMVAVGLSGVLALAAMRLVVNQMNALRVMELQDKSDAIYKFYSNLLHDDKVWWCTLYYGIEQTPPPTANREMRRCVFGKGSCTTPSGGTALRLMGPDCEFKEPVVAGKVLHRFKAGGALDFSSANFESSSVTFIPEGGKTLKDSVVTADSSGWWNIELKWQDMGNNAVDLIFTQKLDRDKWQNATSPKRHLPELRAGSGSGRVLRVRRSTNYVSGGCSGSGVIEIALHTASRSVGCGPNELIDTRGEVGTCPLGDPKGQVVYSTGSGGKCSGENDDRVSVTPTDCRGSYSVIWKIGTGAGLSAGNNVECALEGRGKMVKYGTCRGTATYDSCVNTFGTTISTNPTPLSHNAIYKISDRGELKCATLMGFPTIAARPITLPGYPTYNVTGQGPIGRPGPDGGGPRGDPGPSCL